MTRTRPAVLLATALVMAAFAANSVLARLALGSTGVDPATFTAVRLAAGAAALSLVVRVQRRPGAGGWRSAAALFAYAAAFSFAYLSLSTGTGALVLFGAVQVTMVGAGLRAGERLGPQGWAGLALALGGLGVLVAPASRRPPSSPPSL